MIGWKNSRELNGDYLNENLTSNVLWFSDPWHYNDAEFDYESLTNQPIAGYDGVPLALMQVSVRNFTKRNWRYAIPQSEIDVNPALVQSAGWEN